MVNVGKNQAFWRKTLLKFAKKNICTESWLNMAYEWLDEYCLKKQGVTKDYQPEWQATRYFIGGKMFAMQGGDKNGKPIFTMKLEPLFGDYLRKQYKDIVPGYYMNKQHWNSLYLDGDVPDDVVHDMADKAYMAVLQTLTKKAQKEISELDNEPSAK